MALAACGGGSDDATPPGDGSGPPVAAATAPTITTQPAAQSVTVPAAATFSVAAAGSAPLAYQWRVSANGTDWTDINGATGASYVTGATDTSMNGRYYTVVVTNSAGSVTSTIARLTTVTGSSGEGPRGEFPHTANPLAVAVTRADAALSTFGITSTTDASEQSPPEATDIAVASGVTVSLAFAGNTFLEDQTLSVTPVTLAGLDGAHPLPFQSVIGAFDVAPADDGIPELQANKAVRITFTMSQAALDALGGQPVIFTARSDGTQLHLAPVFANGDGTWSTLTLTTRIGHLGVFGIATVSDLQAQTLADAWPSFDDFQLEAAVAPPSYELRKAALHAQPGAQSVRARPLGKANVGKANVGKVSAAGVAPDTSDWAAQMQARIDAYYNDQVAPALAAASAANADIAQFNDASQKIIIWERMRQLLGLEDERDAEVSQRLIELLQRGFDKAKAECANNQSVAATVQVLGMARQLALLGYETDTTLDWVMDNCGRSKYDVAIDWQQVHSENYTMSSNVASSTAFTEALQTTYTSSGHLHLTDSMPDISGVTFDFANSDDKKCGQDAYFCNARKIITTAHETAPQINRCGSSSFVGSYRVDRWNLDARGHLATPTLYVTFQNPFGCPQASFFVVTTHATEVTTDAFGNSTTATVAVTDQVDTTPWSGSATLGATSRIVRGSRAITGQNVDPGATARYTTSLGFKVTEVPRN